MGMKGGRNANWKSWTTAVCSTDRIQWEKNQQNEIEGADSAFFVIG